MRKTLAFLLAAAASAAAARVFTFGDDGTFRLMQVSDIQDAETIVPRALEVFEKACIRFRPQLIVLTGDNVDAENEHGYFEKTIQPFIRTVKRLGIPFAVTFGNHDSEVAGTNRYTREEQYALYKTLGGNNFVDHDVPELSGTGNGVIPLYSADASRVAFNLFLMDSHAYAGQGFDGCYTDQIAWYETVSGSTPCLWFQHIIVPDVEDTGLLLPAKEGDACAKTNRRDGRWFTLNTERAVGIFNDNLGPTDPDAYTNAEHTFEGRTLYQSWLKMKNLKGAYFGHDHKNTFDGTDTNGIRLGYCKALTLHNYNDDNPGLRVFTIHENGSYETDTLSERSPDGTGLMELPTFSEPDFNSIVLRQLWPWSPFVSIDFNILGTGNSACRMRLTAFDGNHSLGKIPDSALSGDKLVVSDGPKHLSFNPSSIGFLQKRGVVSAFRVELSAVESPALYLVIDLTRQAGEKGQITAITEEALTNGLWGSWVRNPYRANGVTNESVIWTGVAEDDVYRTDKLVLRHIEPGSFYRGYDATNNLAPSANQRVTLSKGFWIGVFELTQAQWHHVTGNWDAYYTNLSCRATRPVEELSYSRLRGSVNGARWPSISGLDSGCFLDKIRTLTGLTKLEIPTAAQWEYACRAGTQTLCNNGLNTLTLPPADIDANMSAVARYRTGVNDQSVDLTKGPGKVGKLLPNSWGLYDMQGNIMEVCRDWAWTNPGSLLPATDPVGPTSGTTRVCLSGSFWHNAFSERPDCYWLYTPGESLNELGVRLIYEP